MMENKIKITSVKLTDYGQKGIEVVYALPSKKNNRQFLDEYKVKRKAPIHDELELAVDALKSHLLDICAYTIQEPDRAYLMENLAITSVENGSKGIVIVGELNVLDGEKSVTLKTPGIETEAEYPELGKLIEAVTIIFDETRDYMDGVKSLTDQQIVLKMALNEEGFDEEKVKRMTASELRDWATEILEKQGCMVFHSEDTTTEVQEEEGEVIDLAPTMQIVKDVIPPVVITDDGDFSLGAAPVAKASTAKKAKTA